MDMRTQASQFSASSVAAKGAFARAGDEDVVVAFHYLFVNNPAAELMLPHLVSAETTLRHTLAQLRLLRMALDSHRRIDSAALRDPFSAASMLVEQVGGGLLLKSAGGHPGQAALERRVTL